jgi:hypothetical protein
MIFIACSRTARQESGCVHVALEYMDTCTAGCAMSQRVLKGPSHVQCLLKVARSADRAGFAFCDFLAKDYGSLADVKRNVDTVPENLLALL